MFIRILRETAAGDGTGGGGAATAEATPAAGASASAPIFTQGDPAGQAAAAAVQKANEDFVKSIPESYREKPYLKGVDSPDKLYKLLDGSQELIGKRPSGVPAADAPKEQWDAFYKTLGRPDAADAYTLTPGEGVNHDADFMKGIKGLFHEAGLTQKQAETIQKGFDAKLVEFAKAKGTASAQADTDFEKIGDEIFGAEKDTKLARAKEIMMEHAPQKLLAGLEKLSSEQLIILGGIVDSIATKFIAPDKLPGNGGQLPGAGLDTMDQRRAKARELMLLPEFNDQFHPKHEAIKKQVNELYAPLQTAKK